MNFELMKWLGERRGKEEYTRSSSRGEIGGKRWRNREQNRRRSFITISLHVRFHQDWATGDSLKYVRDQSNTGETHI